MTDASLPEDLTLLDIHEVSHRVSLSHSSIYRMMAKGDFPKSFALTPKASRWLQAEVDDWITAKAATRHTPRPAAGMSAGAANV